MPKVMVEVLMTDQWASGAYMAEAVKVLPQEVQEVIEVRIWNVKERDGVIRKRELGSKAVPSIAINNNMVFESGIPLQEDLIAAIRNHL